MMHQELFADRMEFVKPSAIRQLLKLASQPDVISFAGGLPDPALFPVEGLIDVVCDVLKNNSGQALQYHASDGLQSLREKLAARMKTAGVTCSPDSILITNGGQQGMDLISKLLLNRGDVVVTERPTFLGGLIAYNQFEIQYKCCSMDKDGMRVDELEEILKTTPKVKFIYTIADFQNPMGVTLSVERRKRMYELASKYNKIIVEDTPYREIRYEGNHLPAIKSLDTENRVIYLGSFSKILSPGMRLGWMLSDPATSEKLTLLKMATDTQCSTLNMCLADGFMAKYDIDAHIKILQASYKKKKDLMLKTMKEYFPAGASWTNPEGGLFTWLTLPSHVDTTSLMNESLLPKSRVAYVPGEGFFPVKPEKNHARINYSMMSEEKIVEGMTRFGKALKEVC